MKRMFVDTSAWVSYVNRRDPDHARVRKAIQSYAGRLVASTYIFDETVTFCQKRLSHEVAVKVGVLLRDPDVLDLIRVDSQVEEEGWALFIERPDKAYSFTDCTSFVLMRRLGIREALSLDDDFRQEGFEVVPSP